MGNEAAKPQTHAEVDVREIQRMDSMVRSKVRGPVQYNMKVVIRGERASGKTALWRRFQAQEFDAAYKPTPEIQTAAINWGFKSNADVVKVEVWDVVDVGFRSDVNNPGAVRDENAIAGIPPLHAYKQGKNAVALLDASIVDVYKDAQAAIFLVNPFSQTSLGYVASTIGLVPPEIVVLVLLNFRDSFESTQSDPSTGEPIHPVVTKAHVEDVVHRARVARHAAGAASSGSEANDAKIYFFECSMQNCYGLKSLHAFLNIPFLLLKEQTLRRQLEQNAEDRKVLEQDFSAMCASNDYDSYAAHFRSLRAAPPPRSPPTDPSSVGQVNLRTEWNLSQSTTPTATMASTASPTRPASRSKLQLAHNAPATHANGSFALAADDYGDDDDLPAGLPGGSLTVVDSPVMARPSSGKRSKSKEAGQIKKEKKKKHKTPKSSRSEELVAKSRSPLSNHGSASPPPSPSRQNGHISPKNDVVDAGDFQPAEYSAAQLESFLDSGDEGRQMEENTHRDNVDRIRACMKTDTSRGVTDAAISPRGHGSGAESNDDSRENETRAVNRGGLKRVGKKSSRSSLSPSSSPTSAIVQGAEPNAAASQPRAVSSAPSAVAADQAVPAMTDAGSLSAAAQAAVKQALQAAQNWENAEHSSTLVSLDTASEGTQKPKRVRKKKPKSSGTPASHYHGESEGEEDLPAAGMGNAPVDPLSDDEDDDQVPSVRSVATSGKLRRAKPTRPQPIVSNTQSTDL